MTRGSARFAIGLLCLTACPAWAPQPVAVPPDLQTDGDSYQVHGGINVFQHHVRFGPYDAVHADTSGVESDWSTPSFRNQYVEQERRQQDGEFELKGVTGTLFRASCRRDRHTRRQFDPAHLDDRERARVLSDDDQFRCWLHRAGEPTLVVHMTSADEGHVTGAQLPIKFRAVDEAGDSVMSSEPSGFVVYGEEVLALVNLSARRSVHLTRKLSPRARDELAAICVALFLKAEME